MLRKISAVERGAKSSTVSALRVVTETLERRVVLEPATAVTTISSTVVDSGSAGWEPADWAQAPVVPSAAISAPAQTIVIRFIVVPFPSDL